MNLIYCFFLVSLIGRNENRSISIYNKTEFQAQKINGKAIYEKNCAICHTLKNPSDYSKDKLQKTVPRMVKKVNRKKGYYISEEQEVILLNYLLSKAS